MKELFERLLSALERGENAVLCTIVKSSGSTPRGAGAKLAVFEDGATVGTVGGGEIERLSEKLAREVLQHGESLLKDFSLSEAGSGATGMICGGEASVFFRRFTPDDAEIIESAAALCGERERAWLVMELYGEKPRCFVLRENGEGAPDCLASEFLALLTGRTPVLLDGFYAEPLNGETSVYVFGAGHVARALAPVLSRIGFAVTVYDERAEFANEERFPDAAEVVSAPFSDAARRVHVCGDDYIVIMTRGHMADMELLEFALRTDAAYVGMIGSRSKVAATAARLSADGFSNSDIARVHSPIGLPIKAETPEEIAISIAAQLIEFRAKRREKA